MVPTVQCKRPAIGHCDLIRTVVNVIAVLALIFLVALPVVSLLKDADAIIPPSLRGLIFEKESRRIESKEPRVAICLVGGARRLELTGPSLLDRVVNAFNNSDLFLHSPLDKNTYKLSLLKDAGRIAAVRIVEQKRLPETEEQKQVMTAIGSPNGLQGLLHYFNLVEGCLGMIEEYQTKNQIQYDWIVRARLDSYWAATLTRDVFIPEKYVVPTGYEFAGLNDRFGAGDPNTSRVGLSRFSLLPELFAAGYRNLNSESAFKDQFVVKNVQFQQVRIPFCVLSDRMFPFPPPRWSIPVASFASQGPLNGAYCRPCVSVCPGECASNIIRSMDLHWSWMDGEPELCRADRLWEPGWDQIYDRIAGEKYATIRKEFGSISLDQCVSDLYSMKRRVSVWDAPSAFEICQICFPINKTR